MTQNAVPKSIDKEGEHRVPNIYEKLLPPLRFIGAVLEADYPDDDLASEKPGGGDKSNPAACINPPSDPRQRSNKFGRRRDSDPMVLTTGRWIC